MDESKNISENSSLNLSSIQNKTINIPKNDTTILNEYIDNSTINTTISNIINKNEVNSQSLDEIMTRSTENLISISKTLESEKSSKLIKNYDKEFKDVLTLNKKPIYIKNEYNKNEFLKFNPKNSKEFDENYEKIRLLYSCQLAPTKIYEGIAKESNKCVAIKETLIDQLDDFHKEFLKNELVIAHYMSKITHSVVIVYDYFHIDNKYVLVMEYSDRPNFFYELLEDVGFFKLF